jgi:DNA-binding SARP family transcriptional activator
VDHKPEALRVRLLGGFSVGMGSRTIGQDEWHLRRAAALIKLLALAPTHRLHREQITEKLWPHLDRRAASNNLRRTLHATRRVLDSSESSRYLVSEEGWLALCPAGALWVDVEAFEDAAATARREREPAAYRAALELYVGSCCPQTATSSGRRRSEVCFGGWIWSCSSNWRASVRNAESTQRPSKR